jgi:polyphosphate kinase 2
MSNYDEEKYQLDLKLNVWQQQVKHEGQQWIIICEGRDMAGKTSFIRRATENLPSRSVRIVALDKPTEEERTEWFWSRFIKVFPRQGEITFWDRSYYNRCLVEPVMGYCNTDQLNNFLSEVPRLEKMWTQSGIRIIKFWFSITKTTQQERFQERLTNPLKTGKISDVDRAAIGMWDEYTQAKERMFKQTDTQYAPWRVINANHKPTARLEAIRYILDSASK